MIEVTGLRKSIKNGSRTVDILKGIDFIVPQGQFAAIMGSSGSGKSTLLGLLAGLDTPTSGSVSLNGVAISYLAEDRLAQVRGKTIGFVFQSYQLIPTLTALENVLLPWELNSDDDKQDGLARARGLLTSVGLGDRLDHYPVQLSGGEQQRVALARAFVLRPPIVLADEPTGNLDTINGAAVLELLLNLNQTEGTTLVLVTHDPVLATYADRRIVLRDGLVIQDEMNAEKATLQEFAEIHLTLKGTTSVVPLDCIDFEGLQPLMDFFQARFHLFKKLLGVATRRVGMEDMVVQLTLGRDEAIVLFDLLCDFGVDDGTPRLADTMNRLSLVRLHGALEKTLVEPFDPQYDASLSAARTRLSRYLSG